MMNPREVRGKEIIEKNNQIIRIDETHYKVNSQSRNIQHQVISLESGWACSCEDNYFRKTCCKHIHAVEISLKIRKIVEPKVISSIESEIKSGRFANKSHGINYCVKTIRDRKII